MKICKACGTILGLYYGAYWHGDGNLEARKACKYFMMPIPLKDIVDVDSIQLELF